MSDLRVDDRLVHRVQLAPEQDVEELAPPRAALELGVQPRVVARLVHAAAQLGERGDDRIALHERGADRQHRQLAQVRVGDTLGVSRQALAHGALERGHALGVEVDVARLARGEAQHLAAAGLAARERLAPAEDVETRAGDVIGHRRQRPRVGLLAVDALDLVERRAVDVEHPERPLAGELRADLGVQIGDWRQGTSLALALVHPSLDLERIQSRIGRSEARV